MQLYIAGISKPWINLTSGQSLLSLRQAVGSKEASYFTLLLNSPALADMKFILLHEAKNDDGIKAFFVDVWELYVKVCLDFAGSSVLFANGVPPRQL